MRRPEVLLVYDKQCPVCHAYCQLVRIRPESGELKSIDARAQSDVLDEITQQGLDIDQGMVVKINDRLYYGADAIHALALLSNRAGLFNRFNYWVFKSKGISGWFYPILRFWRNLLLKLLGKSRVNNLRIPGNEKF